MRSATIALIWEIWSRSRTLVWVVISLIVIGGIVNVGWAHSRVPEENHALLGALNLTMGGISLILVFSIFAYTEFNSQKESIGFPNRLFVLPVNTLLLVAIPMAIGISAVELVYLVSVTISWLNKDAGQPAFNAVLLGGYMVFYQTVLWNLPGLRSLRMVVLGVIAIVMISLGFMPTFPPEMFPSWFSERVLMAVVVASAFISFAAAWIGVSRQRSGGWATPYRTNRRIPQITHALPRRTRLFGSPAAAQFWFEWRRSGFLLPLLVGTLLFVVIAPLGWARSDAGSTLRILAATLAMPLILALPVGKGFSKPDFWSTDVSLPAFIAVKPMATEEIVAVKMKVAAASAALSWILVLAFLSIWLPFWANVEGLSVVRFTLVHTHGVVITVFSLFAAMLLTWRFLVAGLWIGLSGNRRLFSASAAPYALSPLLLVFFLLSFVRPNSSLRVWIREDPDGVVAFLMWVTAATVVGKFALAVFSWRKVAGRRIRNYVVFWVGGTALLVALSVLLPLDRTRHLLILVALLYIPIARIGLAVSSLARSRHG